MTKRVQTIFDRNGGGGGGQKMLELGLVMINVDGGEEKDVSEMNIFLGEASTPSTGAGIFRGP